MPNKQKRIENLDDLFLVNKSRFDINKILINLFEKKDELSYIKGVGIHEDQGLLELLERLGVFELVENDEPDFVFMQSDGLDSLYKIKRKRKKNQNYLDFNLMEKSDWEEIIDKEKIDDFFSKDLIAAKENAAECFLEKYLWDNYSNLNEFIQKNNEIFHFYTLIDDEGGWIVKGRKVINRIGYFISREDIEIKEPIRYW